MKPLSPLSGIFLALLISFGLLSPETSSAETLLENTELSESSYWELRQTEESSSLVLGTEIGSFAFGNSRFWGFGPSLGFQYGLSDSWAGGLGIAQSFDISDGGAFLYTGFDLSLRYALTGTFRGATSDLRFGGRSVIRRSSKAKKVWSVGASIEQFLLSGTDSVYAAPGIGLSTDYSFQVFSVNLHSELKCVLMTYDGQAFPGVFVRVGIPLGVNL